ncbi:MAG TPA: AroM family protein [Rectinemataceae bacterium]|nr:AroM family protein [Rectinemataceae bacterium]
MSNQRHAKNSTLGVLTLGQSPRNDVVPTLRAILGDSIGVVEAGGLDAISPEELEDLAPREGERGIETRLSSGASILVAKARLLPRLGEAFGRLESSCARILLLCSGEFPDLVSLCPGLIQPARALRSIVGSLASNSVLGIVGPASDMDAAPAQWDPFAAKVVCAAASPYEPLQALGEASGRLRSEGADLIFLDDMAFTEEQRLLAASASGLPVLCASTLTARFLFELYSPLAFLED